MIDLDFLSTSSSDSAGLSGAGTVHTSDLTMNAIKEQEDKILSVSLAGSLLVKFMRSHIALQTNESKIKGPFTLGQRRIQ